MSVIDGTTPRADEPAAQPAAPRPRSLVRRLDPLALAAVAIVALFLQPARHAAIRYDDTWTSEEWGIVKLSGENPLGHVWSQAQAFFHSGRPNVLATVQGELTSYAVGDTRAGYHALLIVLTVVAAGLLYALVRELGVSRAASFLTLVLVAGAIQFRAYHDAVLGYWGTTQLVLILTLGSLLLFVRALRGGGRRQMLWSFLLMVPVPLLYEAAYPLVALHLGVALLERRGREAWKVSAPFLALGALFVLLSLYARATANLVVPGYEVGSSPVAALRTYFVQLLTPIPGSNIMFRPEHNVFELGVEATKAELLGGAWRGAVVFATVLLVSLRLAVPGRLRLPDARSLRALAVIGGLLWTTAALVISAAPKYQFELTPGRGHLPALFQVFGFALVAAAGLFVALRAAAGRSLWAVRLTALAAAGLFGLGAAVTGYSNMRVVALESPVAQSRDLLEDATEKGTFADLPERSTLLFQRRDLEWSTGNWGQSPSALEAMLLDRGDRELDGRLVAPDAEFGCEGPGTFPLQDCESLRPRAAWVSVRDWRGGGTVVVAPFVPAPKATGAASETARDLRAFVHSDSGAPGPPQLTGRTAADAAWSGRGLRWRRVAGEGDWAIFETRVTGRVRPLATSLDDARARLSFVAMPTSDGLARTYGTKRLLP